MTLFSTNGINAGPHFHCLITQEESTGAVASEEVLFPAIAISEICAVIHADATTTVTHVEYLVPGQPPRTIAISPDQQFQSWEAISEAIYIATGQRFSAMRATSIAHGAGCGHERPSAGGGAAAASGSADPASIQRRVHRDATHLAELPSVDNPQASSSA